MFVKLTYILSHINHSVLFCSGESGAGKTESAKLLISQLVELSRGTSQLEQQILQVLLWDTKFSSDLYLEEKVTPPPPPPRRCQSNLLCLTNWSGWINGGHPRVFEV